MHIFTPEQKLDIKSRLEQDGFIAELYPELINNEAAFKTLAFVVAPYIYQAIEDYVDTYYSPTTPLSKDVEIMGVGLSLSWTLDDFRMHGNENLLQLFQELTGEVGVALPDDITLSRSTTRLVRPIFEAMAIVINIADRNLD